MDDKDLRKNYWNEKYLDYWKSRVEEAGTGKSQVIAGDSNTEDDSVYQQIFDTHGFNDGSLLEIGCAWGRMFKIYLSFGLTVTGSDISQAMVEAARSDWLGKADINDIVEAPAEDLPFRDHEFDNLACLATLDATFQHKAITEFLRVTRPGARVVFTGKNDHYFQDDKEAYLAEVGARSKGHPNFFTDTNRLASVLAEQGHRIDAIYCFPRRGDFARFSYTNKLDDRFYEFLLVLTRGERFQPLPEISTPFSRTFYELENASG